MRIIPTARIASGVIAACLSLSPLFAGALILQVDDPGANSEAVSKGAVAIAHVTECQSPEKTVVSATAEGLVAGARRSIPLKLIPLATGVYGVSHEWPSEGTWAVKFVVTNPDYGKYVTAALVPAGRRAFRKESVQQLYRVPTEQDIAQILAQNGL